MKSFLYFSLAALMTAAVSLLGLTPATPVATPEAATVTTPSTTVFSNCSDLWDALGTLPQGMIPDVEQNPPEPDCGEPCPGQDSTCRYFVLLDYVEGVESAWDTARASINAARTTFNGTRTSIIASYDACWNGNIWMKEWCCGEYVADAQSARSTLNAAEALAYSTYNAACVALEAEFCNRVASECCP